MIENKLRITNSAELARIEEKISKFPFCFIDVSGCSFAEH